MNASESEQRRNDELLALSSIYTQDELTIDDVSGHVLIFILELMDATAPIGVATLQLSLPNNYPYDPPTVTCQCRPLGGQWLDQDASRLYGVQYAEFLTENECRGRECVFEVVEWWREKLAGTVAAAGSGSAAKDVDTDGHGHEVISSSSSGVEWSRVFLKFHHIFNAAKRRHCREWAIEEGLTGRVRSGKPGFVFIEGRDEDVKRYIARLRGLSWKKMSVSACSLVTIPCEDVSSYNKVYDDMLESNESLMSKAYQGRFEECGMIDFFIEGTGFDHIS